MRIIHRFDGHDGGWPFSRLIIGYDNAIYGTAYRGGPRDCGVLFKLHLPEEKFEVLHFFGADDDGSRPEYGVFQGHDWVLYGTTYIGGHYNMGTVYSINLDGSNYQVIHHFEGGKRDGALPAAMVTLADDGYLYGTTVEGGIKNKGTMFRLKPDGAGYEVIHEFVGGKDDGAMPCAFVILASDGYAYSITKKGGSRGKGVYFKLRSDGSDFQIICSLKVWNQIQEPVFEVEGPDGSLYGIKDGGEFADGVIYQR